MIIAIPDVNGILAVTIAQRIPFQHNVDDVCLLDGLQWTGREDLEAKKKKGETNEFQPFSLAAIDAGDLGWILIAYFVVGQVQNL